MSYERLAARARRKTGLTISGSYLHQLAQGRVKKPGEHKVPAIAAALGMSETQVREAAARSVGLHVEHNVDYRTATLLNLVNDMSPNGRDRWYRLATVIAKELAAEETAPPTTVVVADDRPQPPHTRRVLERGFDEVTARTPPRTRRQHPE